MICVYNWPFWSERREGYTIGKSGPKHQERQNSQSWAHKLHWCGIIWSFACGASLPVLYSPLYHLFYPELTSHCTVFWPATYSVYFFCFNFGAVCFVFTFRCVYLPCIFWFYIVCFFFLQPRSLLDPKVLGLQAGGWVVAHFWSDRLTITHIWAAVLFCMFMLRHMWQKYYWRADLLECSPNKGILPPVLCHTTWTRWIYRMPHAFIMSVWTIWMNS